MLAPKEDKTEQIKKIRNQINIRFLSTIPSITLKKIDDSTFMRKLLEDKHEAIKENTVFAAKVFHEVGMVDPKRFGYEVSRRYWYFVYLSNLIDHPVFIKRYLIEMRKHLKENSILRPLYCRLYDKMNLFEHHTQRYGTQHIPNFEDTIENIKYLNERRNAMNLPTLNLSRK